MNIRPSVIARYSAAVQLVRKPGLLRVLAVTAAGILLFSPSLSLAAVSRILIVPTSQSATIYWTSSSQEPSSVTYGILSGALIKAANDPIPVSFHSLTLSPLVPNTTYYFHIVEQKNDQPKLTSTFRTLPSSGAGSSVIPAQAGIQGFLFTKNLKLGVTDPEVKQLQILLNSDSRHQISVTGIGSKGQESSYFGAKTKLAVIKFQELYAKDILIPNGLSKGTGAVLGSTRAKLNQILAGTKSKPLGTTNPNVQTPVYVGSSGGGGSPSTGSTGSPQGGSGQGGGSPSPTPTPTPTFTPPSAGPSPTPSPTPTPSPSPTPTPTPTPSPIPVPEYVSPNIAPANNECADGIDNDGDGLIDMADTGGSQGAAFGCFGPNSQETSVDYGYTIFTPSGDSKIYYVSAAGDDTNDGLSPAKPLKTIRYAVGLMRDGYPDWVLIKRGEVWHNEEFGMSKAWGVSKSGRSAAEPFLIATYGDSRERPKLFDSSFVGNNGEHVSNIAISGLYFEMLDPKGAFAIYMLSYGENILLEDLYLTSYAFNIQISAPGDGKEIDNLKIRNSVIVDAFNDGFSSGILLGSVKNGLLEGNVIDHNGWKEDGDPRHVATIFNHDAYLFHTHHDITIRKNIFARASANGHSTWGGLVEDNLYLQNPVSVTTAYNTTIRNNVFVDGHDTDTRGRGYGIWPATGDSGGEISGNVLVHQETGVGGPAIMVDTGITNFSIHDNTILDWAVHGLYSSYSTGMYFAGVPAGQNQIYNNVIQQTTGGYMFRFEAPVVPGVTTFSNNHYYSGGESGRWFGSAGDVSKANWQALSHETGATYTKASFVDPTRTAATYNASLGGTNSLNAFLAEARKLSRFNSRPQYSSVAANAWIRSGYVVTGYDQASSYSITVSSDPNGSVSPSTISVAPGVSQTFTFNPAAGYVVSSVLIDGINQGALYSYVFSNINADHSVVVNFAPTNGTGQTTGGGGTGGSTGGSNTIVPPTNSGFAPTAGLVAYYPFNGDANDAFQANHGTLHGGVSFAAGYAGQALLLDGTTGYVDLGTGPSLNGTTDFTVSAWIKGSVDNKIIIAQRDAGNPGYVGTYTFGVGYPASSGRAMLQVYDGSPQWTSTSNGVQSSAIINNGQWHHVVGIRSGGTGSIYVDNVLSGSETGTSRVLNNSIHTIIGADIRDPGASNFNGSIDDVRIYNRALSAGEVSQLYNAAIAANSNQENNSFFSSIFDAFSNLFRIR